MRKLFVTLEIEDNDLIESQVYAYLQSSFGDALKDFTKAPNTDELYKEDKTFRDMLDKLRKDKKAVNDYINKHNFSTFTNK